LSHVCEIFDISLYAFDVTNKCFHRHLSKNRNYPPLVYYTVNNHMYWISDRDKAFNLTRKARDATTKIKSCVLVDEKQDDNNMFNQGTILENIPVSELTNIQTGAIIYSKNNLNDELDEIISRSNYIPAIKNHKFAVTEIRFRLGESDILLDSDPNDIHNINYKTVQELCNKTNTEFKNQSFGSFIKNLKERFYNKRNIRQTFKKEERQLIYQDCEHKCNHCNKQMTMKDMQIDHIVPLATGGTNDSDNLQALCKKCQLDKTKTELEICQTKQHRIIFQQHHPRDLQLICCFNLRFR